MPLNHIKQLLLSQNGSFWLQGKVLIDLLFGLITKEGISVDLEQQKDFPLGDVCVKSSCK